MNFELLNKIIREGEEIDIYRIKNKIYHEILYGGKVYTIIETKNGLKLEEIKWEVEYQKLT